MVVWTKLSIWNGCRTVYKLTFNNNLITNKNTTALIPTNRQEWDWINIPLIIIPSVIILFQPERLFIQLKQMFPVTVALLLGNGPQAQAACIIYAWVDKDKKLFKFWENKKNLPLFRNFSINKLKINLWEEGETLICKKRKHV